MCQNLRNFSSLLGELFSTPNSRSAAICLQKSEPVRNATIMTAHHMLTNSRREECAAETNVWDWLAAEKIISSADASDRTGMLKGLQFTAAHATHMP